MTKEQHQEFIEFALQLKWNRFAYSRAKIIEKLMNKVDELNCSIPDVVEQSEQLVCEYCHEGNKPTCCDKCVDRINSMD